MKCMNQNCDANTIETDDNFCYKCGHWTAKGYSFIKNEDNVKMILNGDAVRQDTRFTLLVGISCLGFLLFSLLLILRGGDIFRPMYFIKRKVDSYFYGYNTAIIKTDNIYNNKIVNSLEEAQELIDRDLGGQNYKCSNGLENLMISNDLEYNYDINSAIINMDRQLYKLSKALT